MVQVRLTKRNLQWLCMHLMSSNSNGYKPKDLLTPHDAFEMFDESGGGDLNEDELAFALEYLNLDVSGSKQEYYMRKFDLDGSGSLEYAEFRKMWLYCCNPFTELKARGISYSRFARAAGYVLKGHARRPA